MRDCLAFRSELDAFLIPDLAGICCEVRQKRRVEFGRDPQLHLASSSSASLICACLHARCSLCQYLTGRVLKAGAGMSAAEQQHVFALSPVRPQPRAPTASKSGFRIIKCSHRPL